MSSYGPGFPDDHFIVTLRGKRRLRPTDVKRSLAKRAAYLEAEIGNRIGDPEKRVSVAWMTTELAAIAQVMEAYEELHPTDGATFRQRSVALADGADLDSVGNR